MPVSTVLHRHIGQLLLSVVLHLSYLSYISLQADLQVFRLADLDVDSSASGRPQPAGPLATAPPAPGFQAEASGQSQVYSVIKPELKRTEPQD